MTQFWTGVVVALGVAGLGQILVGSTTEGRNRRKFNKARAEATAKMQGIQAVPIYEPLASRVPRPIPGDGHALISDYEDLVSALGKMSNVRVDTPDTEAAYTRDALFIHSEVRRFRIAVLDRLGVDSSEPDLAASDPVD